MNPQNQPLAQSATLANRAIPLLQSLGRVEELATALTIRLEPIVNHMPSSKSEATMPSNTVTGRINQVGDILQYLLDTIEL